MDIAAFVGFAASGPLHIPVAVEDAAQFGAIFGDDAPLAWDFERGEQLYAYLGPAVRAFFRNVGKQISSFLLLGYLLAGFTARKQALHDILAGCLVVRTR